MTDKDIIKALECCGSEFECHNGCPYYHNGQFSCRDLSIYRDALALINRQQAEIERLEENEKTVIREFRVVNADKERILLIAAELSRKLKTAKAEAVKEFAERLKSRLVTVTFMNFDDTIDNLVKEMVGEG